MSIQYRFQSALAADLQCYIALKQALGRDFAGASNILFKLDRFLFELGKSSDDLAPDTFHKWCQTLEPLYTNTRLQRIRTVRQFCLYRRRTAPDCFVPDPSQFPKACPVVRPYIFSEWEVAMLLSYCDALPDLARSPLRRAVMRLAIILLHTTGLRRGELLRLTLQDYDPHACTLLIQASKFHKSRLLPLPNDVAKEVERLMQARRSAEPTLGPNEALLASPYGCGRAYTGEQLGQNMHFLLDRAGIKKADGRRPRVHDFRHSFAVNALIRWYKAGVNVQAKLPLLATWLGHVSIFSTYHYLHFVEELRSAANRRFTVSYGELVVPVSKQNGAGR